ncbi:MAG: hypothetical protein ABIO05_06230, partial [Ferruginibacter sp.]
AALLSKIKNAKILNKVQFWTLSFIVLTSFAILPLLQLKENAGKGKNLFNIAERFKNNKVGGKLFANIRSSQDYSNSIIINYLNGSKYYGARLPGYTKDEILQAIKKYQIDHYIYYYSTPFEKENFLNGGVASEAQYIYKDLYPGIIVLAFTH